MELNIVTPSTNIAILGNKVPIDYQTMVNRPLMTPNTTQARNTLAQLYLGMLRQYAPPYANAIWSSPMFGFGSTPFSAPAKALQQSFALTAAYRLSQQQQTQAPMYRIAAPTQPVFLNPGYRF